MEELRYQQICDFLDGKLSTSEKIALNQWRKAKQENEQQFQEVKFLWQKAALVKKRQKKLTIDTDAALTKVHQQLPAATVIPLRRRIIRYAVAVSILILLGSIAWSMFIPSVETIKIATLSNETKQITLADNSVVWLNENSTFTYPNSFDNKPRSVSMTGDVIFEVSHNPQQPFIVTTEDLTIKVLGTKFNVQSSSKINSASLVHVINGKVEVQAKANPIEKVLLTKDMTTQLEKGKLKFVTSFSNNQLFWYHQTLTFKETNLKRVIQTINQAYGTDISLTNKALYTCPFTGTFKAKSIAEILETLQLIYGFELKAIHSSNPQLNYGKCQ